MFARLFATLLLSGAVCVCQTTPSQWKGTNYVPNVAQSTSSATMLLDADDPHAPGTYSPQIVEAEIVRLQASGVNSIRLLPSFYGWAINRAQFIQNLGHLSSTCHDAGISIVVQVWSAIGSIGSSASADGIDSRELWHEFFGTDPASPRNLGVYRGLVARNLNFARERRAAGGVLPELEPAWGTLLAEPGNELIALSGDDTQWPYQMHQRVEDYLADLGTFFSTDPEGSAALAGFDLFNEPDADPSIPIAHYIQFIARTFNTLSAYCPTTEYTVGWARGEAYVDAYDQMLVTAGVGRTYHSFHSYDPAETFAEMLAGRKLYADGLGIPLVVSEFHRSDWTAGVLRHSLEAIQSNGVGAQIWAVLQTNTFFSYHGSTFAIDGLYVPSPDGLTFTVNNPFDTSAFEQWTAGSLYAPPYLSYEVAGAGQNPGAMPTVNAGASYDLNVTSSLAGFPVVLRVAPMPRGSVCAPGAPLCGIFPGIGWLPDPLTTATLLLGLTDVTGAAAFAGAFPPLGLPGEELDVVVYVGQFPIGDWNQHIGEVTVPVRYLVQ